MKMLAQLQCGRQQRTRCGYTLVEVLLSAGIYLFILVGVLVAIQIFALRIYTIGATKLVATGGSRKALNQIRDDIRQAKLLQVGSADNLGNFTPFMGTNSAVGNALAVFSTTNLSAPFSLYYLQTNTISGVSSNVLLWVSVTASSVVTNSLAAYITNLDIFAAEDWNNWPATGTPVTIVSNAMLNNQVYSIKLQFWQWEYPIAVVGGSGLNAYDYYQLRTRIYRRAID
jgi:hypothetical protein